MINDDSVIDITNNDYIVTHNITLTKYIHGVPYWPFKYIYLYSELNFATFEQQNFYKIYKTNFLNSVFIDLEENTNYAFILMFDLLDEYNIQKDITKLESHLKALGQYYPRTKSYCISFLIKKMEAEGYKDKVSELKEIEGNYFQSVTINESYQKLGSKYNTKLKLNEEQVTLLNSLRYPSNNFCNIEFCLLEVLKLYILVVIDLEKQYISEETTLEKELSIATDKYLNTFLNYDKGSWMYDSRFREIITGCKNNILVYCENAVRELFGHKQKRPIDTFLGAEKLKLEIDIFSRVNKLIFLYISKITPPDENTNIELNALTLNRWKINFDILTKNFRGEPNDFVQSIIEISRLNHKNPYIKNIFFAASKFIAKHDRLEALLLYTIFLYHDLTSNDYRNKQLSKNIQKQLFITTEQFDEFERIKAELIKDKDLNKALISVKKIYEVKRKKIELNISTIKEVEQQHSGTVILLNQYLQDEQDKDNNTILSQVLNNKEVAINIVEDNENKNHSIFKAELLFLPIHILTLELFTKNKFSILQSEIEDFAKSNGIFKNQLVESINEKCYEVLDDVLIDEEGDCYIINPEYFQIILKQ